MYANHRDRYFFPPVPLEEWTEGPYITQSLFATNISGASHITLRGLGIHHSRGNGLLAIDVKGVRVEGCEISGHGCVRVATQQIYPYDLCSLHQY